MTESSRGVIASGYDRCVFSNKQVVCVSGCPKTQRERERERIGMEEEHQNQKNNLLRFKMAAHLSFPAQLVILEDGGVPEDDRPYHALDLILRPRPQQDALGSAASLGSHVPGFL